MLRKGKSTPEYKFSDQYIAIRFYDGLNTWDIRRFCMKVRRLCHPDKLPLWSPSKQHWLYVTVRCRKGGKINHYPTFQASKLHRRDFTAVWKHENLQGFVRKSTSPLAFSLHLRPDSSLVGDVTEYHSFRLHGVNATRECLGTRMTLEHNCMARLVPWVYKYCSP